MAIPKDSYHLIPPDDIPRIDGTTTFQEVYKRLYQAERGGFFLMDGDRVQSYVKAFELAQEVTDPAKMNFVDPPAAQDDERVRARMKTLARTPIKRIAIEHAQSSAIVRVEPIPVSLQQGNENQLRQQADAVFEVRNESESIGWYLNHETVRETITVKTIFVCTNPKKPHVNPDPDSGTCYSCPYSVTPQRGIL